MVDAVFGTLRALGVVTSNPPAGTTKNPGIIFTDDIPTGVQGPGGTVSDWNIGGGGTDGTVDFSDLTITSPGVALLADYFGVGLIPVDLSGGDITITIPTLTVMGLPTLPDSVRVIGFSVIGTANVNFAGATGSSTVNGVAGPTVGFTAAIVGFKHIVMTQLSPNSDNWSVE